jgi:hypothetical protein
MWQNGENLANEKIKGYYKTMCEVTGITAMFPLILNEDPPKCSFTDTEQPFIQNCLRCVLVPLGCSSKLKFAEFRIFETTSFIGIADVITIFVVYMDLILLCSDYMHDVYKSYYRLLSRLVRKFIAPVQKIVNVEPLYWRITEFRALTEGLFPIGCMSYMLHSLQCIAKHIFEKGPISSFGGLRGECNIAKVKRQVNTSGGLNIQLSATRKINYRKKR